MYCIFINTTFYQKADYCCKKLPYNCSGTVMLVWCSEQVKD